MNLTTGENFLFFGIISITTILIRFLPFLLFPENKKTPKYIEYLGRVLPFTIIGMLVVYCLKDVSVISYPFGLPEALAILVIIILHVWKSNTLLSIGVGTVLYMILLQFVF
ncbi:hypothetical protein acsn021_21500 [Anaerocolumna cellulosilytica]|uniref:Uncharacterized protein n=1 Tax=Anaerocolumna cellulosilytica TaxID=433286 RepID=A0A6S6R6C7_9FIRM|nr:AzlD domain-containing protein [Anaerocolumna cellulosilytica]MBB5194207.1 branched-subunit amino acid transport protein AzlD [Anaerocolumna cellulosilytica]BCJ94581.1 hypothetical protein acsn021_21500 [Anaerocolumna cellulosilytica]